MIGHSGSFKNFIAEIPAIKRKICTRGDIFVDIESCAVRQRYRCDFRTAAGVKRYHIYSFFPHRIKNRILVLIPFYNALAVFTGIEFSVLIRISEEVVSISCIRHIKGKILSVCDRSFGCGNSISAVRNGRVACNAYGSSTCGSGAECSRSNIVGFACGYVVNNEEVASVRRTVIVLYKCCLLGVIKHAKSIVTSRCGNSNITRYERYEHKQLLILSVKGNV